MAAEHVDVLIVGAGLSGIGAACHLRRERPGTTFTVLESRDTIGGTWDLFRYPGVRSDSDMFTLGYSFKPWTGQKSIADGDSILRYVQQAAAEYQVDDRIRFGHRVVRADWSSGDARWTVTAECGGRTVTITCTFLMTCAGYYRYDQGYLPQFPGLDDFTGTVVHPQHWPADLDYAGRNVVVIGSGATAVTLVPNLAEQAAHVTMLQRSPTYIASLPDRDKVADRLRRRLPARTAYRIIRWKNVLYTMATYQLSRRRPQVMKSLLRKAATASLPRDFDIDTHLTPSYDPWDQRLCLVPNGDLFRAIREKRAEIVTGHIDRFTPTAIRLVDGRELPADVVVTATGLNLQVIGGMTLAVDGRPVAVSEHLAYKGMMLSDVPNFSMTIGYTNASWTLRADLVARYVCRLLAHMEQHGYRSVTPVAGTGAAAGRSIIELQSGYVLRSADQLPRQGTAAPWRNPQNYLSDLRLMGRRGIADSVRFEKAV